MEIKAAIERLKKLFPGANIDIITKAAINELNKTANEPRVSVREILFYHKIFKK